MNTQDVINSFQNVVIQIATPTGTGTGFYLRDHDLIITNNHVVKGSNEVVISGRAFKRTMSPVCFTDVKHDLAFIKPPSGLDIPKVMLGQTGVRDGDEVIAVGHPYGLDYTATVGIVSKAARVQNGVNYIQIDAAINPGNSGGPLVNLSGEIVGVNSFIYQNADGLGFALPVSPLIDDLNEYKAHAGKFATRCAACSTLVTAETIDGEYCPSCGAKVELVLPPEQDYKPSGAAAMVEMILNTLGKDIRLSRRGANNWEVEEGSAKIRITYNQQSYFITADAHLCQLPKANIAPIYEFVLHENYTSQGLLFSVNGQNIVLSALIYDEYLNEQSGLDMFRRLFTKADEYDNILIEKYGALPRAEG
ncbi:MAG: trypsin-like peptidase domain-containing protein [Rhizobacter sp.]|nr:trypsin-like peptidase domain-containing protein [Chlorobiales bacterium]